MTSADLIFISTLLSVAAMLTCMSAVTFLVFVCPRNHWPLYSAAIITALAYNVQLDAPALWTPTVYIAFEAAVGLLALFVGDAWWIALRKPVGGALLFLFAALATGAPLLALDSDRCAHAYVLLGIASMIAAMLVYECHPRDQVEKIARLGLSALLAFQAARGLLAFAACEEPVLMAVLSAAGWAVHVTAFGLIAWAARR